MRSRSWEGKLLTAAVLLIIAAGLVLLAASKWNGGSPLLVLFLLIAAALLAAVCWYAGKHNEWHWSFAAAGVSFCVMLFSLVEALFVPGEDE